MPNKKVLESAGENRASIQLIMQRNCQSHFVRANGIRRQLKEGMVRGNGAWDGCDQMNAEELHQLRAKDERAGKRRNQRLRTVNLSVKRWHLVMLMRTDVARRVEYIFYEEFA